MTKPSFEESFSQLEKIVHKLEEGGLVLDEALSLFEEGMGLAQQCIEQLEAAQFKLRKLQSSFNKTAGAEGSAEDGLWQ
ncbi:MAG: exodeoxyribonuclease VII small subunit [Chloroflexi bacterium]|nr:exodeoxyribonuclease VII small subunit [Chloroflexota bacterium]